MCQDLEVLMSCKINGLIPFQFHISKITFFFLCPSSASVYTLTFALPVYYNFCVEVVAHVGCRMKNGLEDS